jgi:(p)ppGpp synthase/HD superfamily hydrolase
MNLRKVIEFAFEAHEGQKRKGGAPYIIHPANVAMLVYEWGPLPGNEVIAAAWLHDVIEDCGVTPKLLEKNFGKDVTSIVVELTNVYTKEAYPDLSRLERKKKEFFRLSKVSYWAKIIKAADRIDNLETKDKLGKFGELYVTESLDLYKALMEGIERIFGPPIFYHLRNMIDACEV